MKRISGIVCGFLVGLFGFSAAIAAQVEPTYGVDSISTYVVTAWDMEPTGPTVAWTTEELNRWQTSSGAFYGALHVPQGARLISIELEACDSSASGEVLAYLFRGTSGGALLIADVVTGEPDVPGCSRFAEDLAVAETVDNYANRYIVGLQNTTYDGFTSFAAVRIHYQLQVTPSPGTATFNDVPTSDPAFQFIEALVASGITAGCGGGNYCPDALLTRRQMAVFLSKALGLHWPDGPQF